MSSFDFEGRITDIVDYPKPGVVFKDITTLLKDPDGFEATIDAIAEHFKDAGVTKVVGAEARGFMIGTPVAYRLHAGFVPARKPGKLPCDTVQQTYAKEYGTDTIEIHNDAIDENDVILLHDDLLATGGTMKAACDLVKKFHPKKVYCNFIIELINENMNGRDVFDDDIEITTLLQV